ncbi:MAG TPA: DUF3102 domain-containing protein [Paenibacillus sp.]|uniref:DnaJ domain-containing protein n=1 Tax=Paenibacillus TaxID=44249 RepID=UPI000BA0ACCD|nr:MULTISPECIES: DnaJ domain-containing protein [Paenibacillus]OZQ60784.1 hypothetical protein CA599_29515 [Paenibacillus taichungensis]HBU80864.1 DUF3102 domain-containing protein [Paenibacillus sp.]
MESAVKQKVFAADLPSIERRLAEIEQLDRQHALEKGMLLKHVRDYDLTHGHWLRWLETVGIGERTAQRYIQAHEQFGNATHASGLSMSALFDLIQLPPDINRNMFVSSPQPIPSTGERKLVTDMSRDEVREVVRAAREAQGLTKRKQPRTATAKPAHGFSDVWGALDSLIAELTPFEKETIESLPLSLTRRVMSLAPQTRTTVLDVASKLSSIIFTDNIESIMRDAEQGVSSHLIVSKYVVKPDAQSLSGIIISPYEILGLNFGENDTTVRKRYRDLSKKVHPDVGGSELLFKLVNKAYEAHSSRRWFA